MTKDEIIEMWKNSSDLEILGMPYSMIETFAKLVAAKEREACALICERVFKRMCPEAQENEVGIEAELIRARGEQHG